MERGISPLRDVIALVRIWGLCSLVEADIVEFSTPKAGLLGMPAARVSGLRRESTFLRGSDWKLRGDFDAVCWVGPSELPPKRTPRGV